MEYLVPVIRLFLANLVFSRSSEPIVDPSVRHGSSAWRPEAYFWPRDGDAHESSGMNGERWNLWGETERFSGRLPTFIPFYPASGIAIVDARFLRDKGTACVWVDASPLPPLCSIHGTTIDREVA